MLLRFSVLPGYQNCCPPRVYTPFCKVTCAMTRVGDTMCFSCGYIYSFCACIWVCRHECFGCFQAKEPLNRQGVFWLHAFFPCVYAVLDMSCHVSVYTAVLAFLRSMALCPPLVPLLLPAQSSPQGSLLSSSSSLSHLLSQMESCLQAYSQCLG